MLNGYFEITILNTEIAVTRRSKSIHPSHQERLMKILCLFPLSDAGQTIHEVLKRCPDLTSVLVHSNRDACQEIASGKYHTIVTSHNPPDIDLFGILDYLSSLEILLQRTLRLLFLPLLFLQLKRQIQSF